MFIYETGGAGNKWTWPFPFGRKLGIKKTEEKHLASSVEKTGVAVQTPAQDTPVSVPVTLENPQLIKVDPSETLLEKPVSEQDTREIKVRRKRG